ncbi:hypothetical protein VPH35_046377 [Triticum aestivum]|uniref:RING-type domain-containing protein n=1 Tax=Triticum turgidum subsp. durum TaxID=4567 RepID=A0A9R0RTX2_TRITD|nr:unnamed protein product [Triticum turgidum subsp. durum]
MEDSTETAAAMAAPAVLPPWPHAAAATETRSRFQGQGTIHFRHKPRDRPCFLRLHGDLILTQGSRAIGPRGGVVCVTDQVFRALDQRYWFRFDPTTFKSMEACSRLIHVMLTEALAAGEHGNWEDSLRTPALNIAMGIVRYLRSSSGIGDLGYDVDIEMPHLHVSLVDKEAAGVTARGRKRKRRREPREVCAIYLLDLEIEDGFLGLKSEDGETASRLPCSHAFHSRCIMPWFHKATTCPTCRHDVMECFSFQRSLCSDDIIRLQAEVRQFLDVVADDDQFQDEVAQDSDEQPTDSEEEDIDF